MRFKNLQPLGHHYDAIEPTELSLSEDAVGIIGECFAWAITGLLPGIIFPARKQFLEVG